MGTFDVVSLVRNKDAGIALNEAVTTQAMLIVKVNGNYQKLIPGETHYKCIGVDKVEITSCHNTNKTGIDRFWFPKGKRFTIGFPNFLLKEGSRETHRDKFVKLLDVAGIKRLYANE